jgi:hypothetical protein
MCPINLTRQKANDVNKQIMIDDNDNHINIGPNAKFLAEKDGILEVCGIQADESNGVIFVLFPQQKKGFKIQDLNGLWLIQESQR